MSSSEAYRGGSNIDTNSILDKKISRRGFLGAVAGVAVAATAGGYELSSRKDTQVSQDNESDHLAVIVEPTEATVEETAIEQSDSMEANPKLEHMSGIYGEGETTPETYLNLTPLEIRKMFRIPNALLKGGRGEHAGYLNAITELFSNAAKPGRTEQELMEFMRPEFFADTSDMDSSQLATLKSEIDLAISNYVQAMTTDKYTDDIYDGGTMASPNTNRYGNPGYKMLFNLRATALHEFAKHALEYRNTNWNITFSAGYGTEDIRGESVGIDADLTINVKAWDSEGEPVKDSVEKAKIGFMGKSYVGGVQTAFLNESDDRYISFMEALNQISQS